MRRPASVFDSRRPLRRLTCVIAALVFAAGCSIKKLAINSLADTLAGSGDVYATDDDPELIRAAVPFSLKTIESLLAEVPDHPGLLLAACSGFTQYAYAFPQADAELVENEDYERAQALRERAMRLYSRARRYCLRRLEHRHPGIGQALEREPAAALAAATREDVATMYWTGAAWGSEIALGLDRPELIANLPAPRALMARALALDETFAHGAIHAAMISLEALPESMGGSPARARRHFERAVELSNGQSAGPYVTMATAVALPAQERAEFERLLNQALAIDADRYPDWRLANLIVQKKARYLSSRVAELFPEEGAVPDRDERLTAAFRHDGVALVPRAATWRRVGLAPRQGGDR